MFVLNVLGIVLYISFAFQRGCYKTREKNGANSSKHACNGVSIRHAIRYLPIIAFVENHFPQNVNLKFLDLSTQIVSFSGHLCSRRDARVDKPTPNNF